MSHARQTIREAIATLLRNTPTNWGSVLETRLQSTRQEWPYVMVFADSETSNAMTVHAPTVYSRSLTIFVVGMLRLPGTGDVQTVEDLMDDLAVEVETKLTSTTLRAIVSKVEAVELVATKMDVILEVDGIDHAEVHMTWRVQYATAEGAASTLI